MAGYRVPQERRRGDKGSPFDKRSGLSDCSREEHLLRKSLLAVSILTL
jgi:hypothetical protein